MNKQQVKNCRMAYAVLAGIPANRIDLNIYRKPHSFHYYGKSPTDKKFLKSSTSIACVAGWLSAHPYFKKQGLCLWKGSYQLFGFWDAFFADDGLNQSDHKRVALTRFRKALLREGVISYERNKELRIQEYSL